jgi:hypothetical protein
MYLQDSYSYSKILDKKKYLDVKEVDFQLPDPTKPLKDPQSKLMKLQLTSNSKKSLRSGNLDSARDGDTHSKETHHYSKAALLSNSSSTLNLPLLERSLLTNRSVLSVNNTKSWYQNFSKLSITVGGSEYDETGLSNLSAIFGSNPPKITEFSDRHLGSLSHRIETLPSEYGELDKPLEKGVDIDALLMQLDKKDQTVAPIKLIHANSKIGLECCKQDRQYFKIKCGGYKFPMKIIFIKRNLHFKIFLSLVHKRPDELKNEYQSIKHSFEVNLSAFTSSSSEPPTQGEVKVDSIYMCILPEGDFKDTMAVLFEARDNNLTTEPLPNKNQDSIDYKGLLRFSEQFQKNVRTLTYYQKMEAKKDKLRQLNLSQDSGIDDENDQSQNNNSKVHNSSILSHKSLFDPEMLIDFKKKREMRRAELARIDEERRELAKLKARMFQQEKEQEVMGRKLMREKHILQKRMMLEGMVSLLIKKTSARSWISQVHFIRCLQAMHSHVKFLRAQKDLSMKKFHAAIMLVRAFKKFIQAQGEKYVTIIDDTPDEVKTYQVKAVDAKSTLLVTHLIAKNLKWNKIIPLAFENIGLFYKSVSRCWILSKKFFDLRRRVANFHKSFRKFKHMRRIYIQACIPILIEAIEDMKRIAEEKKLPALNVMGKLQHTPEEIISYLFEFHLFSYVKEKYSNSELPYKDFKSLGSRLEKPECADLKAGAILEQTSSGLNSQKYSRIVNQKRQKEIKEQISSLEPAIVTIKSKLREEQVKKLKVILKFVCEKLEGFKRFDFEFNEVSARLFLVGYFRLDKRPDLLAVHEICTNSATFESQHEGGPTNYDGLPDHASAL